VSGLTLKSPHSASCPVMHGCVLCGHRAQLQEELVHGLVSGEGDAVFVVGVISVTIATYLPCPL
jgi:hypothetical protein